MTVARALFRLWTAALASAAGLCAAAPFEVAVVPSRFEITGKSGARLGQSLEIHNLGSGATEIAVRTLDWSYSPQGDIAFLEALQADSCRPWVTLERRTLIVPPRGKASFRFQIDPPADAPRRECRFMIAIEGVEPAYRAAIAQGTTSLSIPVTGRIAVAVYLALNGARAQLSLQEVGIKEVRGQRVPAAVVSNTGDAHGRLEGSLDATDAQGTRLELVPEGTPVMPGQTRTLALRPRPDGNGGRSGPPPVPPLKASGLLEWAQGAFRINAELR